MSSSGAGHRNFDIEALMGLSDELGKVEERERLLSWYSALVLWVKLDVSSL